MRYVLIHNLHVHIITRLQISLLLTSLLKCEADISINNWILAVYFWCYKLQSFLILIKPMLVVLFLILKLMNFDSINIDLIVSRDYII